MVQVYAEPLCRRHYSPWYGDAVIARVGLFLIAVVLGLVVSFATGGFWVKLKPTIDQPTVHYTKDALLLFEGAQAGQEQIWSSSPVINEEFSDYFVPATVQVSEEDLNYDDKPDVITLVAKVQGSTPIYGVKALLQFHYSFSSNVRLSMYSFAYLAYASPTPGGALYTDGELVLNQKNPITDRQHNGIYNIPMLNSSTPPSALAAQGSTTLEFHNILKSYLDRNYTTAYTNNYPVWRPGQGNSFELTMRIRIPPNQLVYYRPQMIEMLKFGWIQFLATYICLWWFFWWFQRFLFRFRIVSTRVVSDITPKTQRF